MNLYIYTYSYMQHKHKYHSCIRPRLYKRIIMFHRYTYIKNTHTHINIFTSNANMHITGVFDHACVKAASCSMNTNEQGAFLGT